MENLGSPEQPELLEKFEIELTEEEKNKLLKEERDLRISQISGEGWNQNKFKRLKEIERLLKEKRGLTEEEQQELRTLRKKQFGEKAIWTPEDRERLIELELKEKNE